MHHRKISETLEKKKILQTSREKERKKEWKGCIRGREGEAAWGFEDRNEMELYSRGDGNPCKFCYWLGIRLIVEKEDPLRNYCRSPVKKGLGPGTKE